MVMTMPFMHKEMHKRTCRKQYIWQIFDHMRSMLHPQKITDYEKKAYQHQIRLLINLVFICITLIMVMLVIHLLFLMDADGIQTPRPDFLRPADRFQYILM
jgi:hypothetical protein